MKLFIHDEKHDQIIYELELGNLNEKEKILVEEIIKFLNTKMDNRYFKLVMAESYIKLYDDNDDEFLSESYHIEFLQ